MSKTIKIGNRIIGEGHPAYIIAEMSGNHAGSLENAKAIVRAAKEAGADCVKIQTYTADTLTIDCQNKYFHIDNGTWEGENLYNLYQKAYTPWEWQPILMEEAKKVGIDFFSTPFDSTSVDFLEEMGVEFYKIASFELVDIPLIEYVASKKKPIIMSVGLASFEEISEAVSAARRMGNDQIALLKCASAYPAITDEMNLSTIKDISEKFDVPAGLSDHSMGYVGALTAVALGGNIIEKHFCLSREIENPDSSFSMEPNEFADMVKMIRDCERAIGTVSYGPSPQEINSLHFRKSIFCIKDISPGDIISVENVKVIRPGDGLAPKYWKDIIGKRANTFIERGTPFSMEFVE